MSNIWFLLIWLIVVALEGFIYSFSVFYLAGPDCQVTRISFSLNAFIMFADRFIGYQSWFIPLIYLYWPS